MVIEYLINGYLHKTNGDCSDMDIKVSVSEGRLTANITAKADLTLKSAVKHYSFAVNEKDLYFFNGYQSWTDSKEFYLKEKEKDVYKLPKFLLNAFSLDGYGDATFYKYAKNFQHGYDVFWSKGETERFIYNVNKSAYLIFRLNKKEGVLSLISDINGKSLRKGESYTVYDYFYYENYNDGLKAFNGTYPEKQVKKILGYTSWYNYYQNINQDIIKRDLDALDKRFDLFQIDDGYETFVGDWLDVDKNKFKDGLAPLVESIHSNGFIAGIWLAPFVAEEKSRLFQEHKEYFKKDKQGNFVKCGSNWSGFYALDITNTEAKEYIKKCLTYYKNIGFDFFKLDFLYAVHLADYEGKSRCEVATESYNFLREVLGDKLILGCGAMVYNSEVFDYLRIGPDVSLKFDDVFYMKWLHRERPSTKVTLQNTVYRSVFDKRFFGNDPDVFLLREDNIGLSYDQRLAIITVDALFGSLMMTSDNIKEYDEKKEDALKTALKLFYNAREVTFERNGKYIDIGYKLDGNKKTFRYDTKKGVING